MAVQNGVLVYMVREHGHSGHGTAKAWSHDHGNDSDNDNNVEIDILGGIDDPSSHHDHDGDHQSWRTP